MFDMNAWNQMDSWYDSWFWGGGNPLSRDDAWAEKFGFRQAGAPKLKLQCAYRIVAHEFRCVDGNTGKTILSTKNCYSGQGRGKNNPSMENLGDPFWNHHAAGTYQKTQWGVVHLENDEKQHGDWGPVPEGSYTFGEINHSKGPNTVHLIPAAANSMFGRDSFCVHGDNTTHTASHGCIIMMVQSERTKLVALIRSAGSGSLVVTR
jgi:hypothetical protein